VSYLVDSDWLIDAFIGVPAAVNLLARFRTEGLAVSKNLMHRTQKISTKILRTSAPRHAVRVIPT
jgi:hypothetical protein